MDIDEAVNSISHGCAFPFDAPDLWWSDNPVQAPEASDWAHVAARGIIANLQDRAGIKHHLSHHSVDEDTRQELVAVIAQIIRICEGKHR